MEIVRSNFQSQLPSILEDVRRCDFISIDGEFTGISKADFKARPFDTVPERYTKLRQGNMDYLMCQVGLCMFFQQPDGDYLAKPYKFYVTPQTFGHTDHGKSFEFTCQASSMNFLASHGFDFNKVFCQGISYLRPSAESKIRDTIMEKEEKRSTVTETPIAVKGEDKKFINGVMKKVEEYFSSTTEDDVQPLDLEPCSPFRRKITYQYVRFKYPVEAYMESVGEGREKHIQVSKINTETRKAKEQAVINKKLEDLQVAVGFSHVIKEISSKGKMLVGHNMLLDLMYFVSQFMAELPETYEEFKAMVTELFPRLLDTKVISSTYLFKEDIPHTSLDELIKALTSSLYQQINIVIPEGFPDYEAPDCKMEFHDAGYDAYTTGKCFAIMAHTIGLKATPPVQNLASNSKLLTPFINKIYLNRIQDIPYMNLAGPEVLPDREHLYYLSFPNTWTRQDINQVFFPSLIYVTWIDNSSAMVSLQERSENAQVKKLLSASTLGCVVVPYAEWHKQQLKSQSLSPKYEQASKQAVKRKHSGTESSTPGESDVKLVKVTKESETAAAQTSLKADKLFQESNW
ncbi:poly(A)-specific ribonuclease PARN-like [Watersipora subatra]|uniref:poly(A)-specific ribonuclease PARN-like n=1 Tax=Watersipora subatra TaxID=2589382 RepID=UPI00355C8AF7